MPKQQELLLQTLRAILRPAARFCLRHGLKIQDAYEVLKFELLAAAKETLEQNKQPSSSSRLSILTGLQRRDVDRVNSEEVPNKSDTDLLSKVLGQWQHDKRFSANGKPRVLSSEGTASEFFSLVASVSKNLNPYTILFELERIGLVQRTTQGVKLKKMTYQAVENADEAIDMLGHDLEVLEQAVEENIFDRQEVPQLHTTTHYDNIAPEHAATIREWLLNQGKDFHAKARKYLSQFDRDINKKLKGTTKGASVTVSSFSLTKEKK